MDWSGVRREVSDEGVSGLVVSSDAEILLVSDPTLPVLAENVLVVGVLKVYKYEMMHLIPHALLEKAKDLTLHGDVGTALDCCANRGRVDHVLQVRARASSRHSSQFVNVDVLGGYAAHVQLEDVSAPLDVRLGDHDLCSASHLLLVIF